MRELATADLISRFMSAFGREAGAETNVYFTGGASAVLLGWRETTIDVDLKLVPEDDRMMRAIPGLKESLHLNLELACPDQFIPALAGWQERSLFVGSSGRASFFHYDFYSQALAKIERGHAQDREDVGAMLARNLVDRRRLLEFFQGIEPRLYKYPALDPIQFRKAVESVARGGSIG